VLPHAPQVNQLGESSRLSRTVTPVVLGVGVGEGEGKGVGVGEGLGAGAGTGVGDATGAGVGDGEAARAGALAARWLPPQPMIVNDVAASTKKRESANRLVRKKSSWGSAWRSGVLQHSNLELAQLDYAGNLKLL
jgi:hypothetical protein